MVRNDYWRIGLVWLAALLVESLAVLLIPLGSYLPVHVAGPKAASAAGIDHGVELVLHMILTSTFPGLVLGLGITRGVWKHVGTYAVLQAVAFLGFGLIGGLGFGVVSRAAIAAMVAPVYGVMVGGLVGTAVRHRIGL